MVDGDERMSERELEERIAALERCCYALTMELGIQNRAIQALIDAVPAAGELLRARAAAEVEAEVRRQREAH